MRGSGPTGRARRALYAALLSAAALVPGDVRSADGPFPHGRPAHRPQDAGSWAMLPPAPTTTVRVTRASRWASEDPADFICKGAQDECFRSLLAGGPSGVTGQPQTGAGILVDAKGHILTANALVGCEASADVQFADGRAGNARVVGRDPLLDVALLEVKVAGGRVAASPLGNVAELTAGSPVAIAAWDRNVPPQIHLRRGSVLRMGRVTGSGLFGPQIETDIPPDEAQVGAPLLAMTGKVVGLIVSPLRSPGRGARAVPTDAVQEVLPQLAGLGRVPRGWAGLMLQQGTPSLADALGGGWEGEPVVAHVIREGPADRAGIRPGDIVVLFGGVRIRSVEGMAEAIVKSEIGSTVRVDMLRGGRLHPFSIRVAETPQSGDWPPRSDPLPKLGIHVLPVTAGLRHLWDPRLANGLLVTRVVPAGPGEAAGLEPGDLLRAVNGHVLVGREAVGIANQALPGGAPAVWLVERDGLTRLVVAPARHRLAKPRGPGDGRRGASRSGYAQGR